MTEVVPIKKASPAADDAFVADVQRRVHVWMKGGKGRSQGDIARGAGIGRSTLNFFINGKYAEQGGDVLAVARAIDAFLTREMFGEQVRVKLNPVETPCYRAIVSTLDAVKHSGDIAIVTGPPGCGKTFAARSYAELDPRYNLVIDIHDGMSSPQGFTAVLRTMLSGSAGRISYGYLERMVAEVVSMLKDRPRFLILNDAQKLSFGVFDLACYFSEVTELGVAFVGHSFLLTEIQKRHMRDHEAYDRVADRAVFCSVDHDATTDDIEGVARQLLPTVTDEAVAFLSDRAVFPSMRTVVITCKLARRALGDSNAPADLKLLKRARVAKQSVR